MFKIFYIPSVVGWLVAMADGGGDSEGLLRLQASDPPAQTTHVPCIALQGLLALFWLVCL